MPVLENAVLEIRTMRKEGFMTHFGGGILHEFNNRVGKRVWKGSSESGKGGLGQSGSGLRIARRFTTRGSRHQQEHGVWGRAGGGKTRCETTESAED